MADVKWIKITTDIFDDEKISIIESLPSADTIIVVWFKLLVLAGKQNNDGVFILNDRIPFTDEMLAGIFRRPLSSVKIALQTFEELGMIEIVEGVYTIPNWKKHQALDQYEKKKAYDRQFQQERRNEQKRLIADKSYANRTTVARQSCDNRTTIVQQSYSVVSQEEDIENKNKNKNKNEEKEIHSFIHSCADAPEERRSYMRGVLGDGLVLLSQEQFDDLCEKLTNAELDKYIAIVRDCEKSGKRFKSKTHYQAILDMARADRSKESG